MLDSLYVRYYVAICCIWQHFGFVGTDLLDQREILGFLVGQLKFLGFPCWVNGNFLEFVLGQRGSNIQLFVYVRHVFCMLDNSRTPTGNTQRTPTANGNSPTRTNGQQTKTNGENPKPKRSHNPLGNVSAN